MSTPIEINTEILQNLLELIQSLPDGAQDQYIATTSGTGAAYTATVPGIKELKVGASFVMIPHTASTTTVPTLNVNGFGAKELDMNMCYTNNFTTIALPAANWLTAGIPVRVMYNGYTWSIQVTRQNVDTIVGTLPVKSGGTGKTTLTSGSYLVGNGTSSVTLKTVAQVKTDLGLDLVNDYVEAYGTTDFWTWRQWSSGIAECWGKKNFGTIACTAAYGSWYESTTHLTADFPSGLFNVSPSEVNISFLYSSAGTAFIQQGSAGTGYPDKLTEQGTGKFWICSPTSKSSMQNTTIGFHVIGTWK